MLYTRTLLSDVLKHTCTHITVSPSIDDPQPMAEYTVQLLGDISIPLTAAGRPFPDITWRNGSTVLTNGSRITINSAGSLTVTDVTLYDRGNYSLTLSNIDGSLTRKFSVFVPCECAVPRCSCVHVYLYAKRSVVCAHCHV